MSPVQFIPLTLRRARLGPVYIMHKYETQRRKVTLYKDWGYQKVFHILPALSISYAKLEGGIIHFQWVIWTLEFKWRKA